jgi:glycosyltransferase involved in cell wall biosynthesis
MPATSPLLTVVTAVYNGAEYISETIDSVLSNASKVSFEYIVVNDGSTDSTLQVLESYKGRIKIIDQKNVGESTSVSRAFQEANGKYLLVVSADDPLLTPRIFENVFDWFEEDNSLVAVYPDWQMIDPVGAVIQTVLVPDYSDKLLIGRCRTLPGPGVIFRKDATLEIGGRRSKWVYVGDYDFWLRLSRLGEIRHRPELLAQWRHHPNSTSVSRRGIAMAAERVAVVEEFLAQNTIEPKLAREALGHAYYMASRLAFFDSKVPGKNYLMQSFLKRKGWVEEARIEVIAYILLMPLSTNLVAPFRKLKKLRIRNL